MGSVQTAHGLAGFVAFSVVLVLLFHFAGFRIVFAAGRAVA